jgi:hypothetical protein
MDMRQKPRVNKTHLVISLVLAILTVSVFALFKHFVDGGLTWTGGRSGIVQFAAAGAFFGVFPALAGLAVAVHRIRASESADGLAALFAGGIWLIQYGIIVIVNQTLPSWNDFSYGIVSVLSVALLAKLIEPKPIEDYVPAGYRVLS